MIRPMVRADVDVVLGLWRALVENGRAADPRFAIRADAEGWMRGWIVDTWLRTTPFPHALVADDGVVFGFVTGWPQPGSPVLDDAGVARIGDLFVAAGRRRGGVGAALVKAWSEGARAAGYHDVVVETLTLDARAVAFWRSQGFGDFRVALRRDDQRGAG
jgi:GNAT superfamily N-acetyltransferase